MSAQASNRRLIKYALVYILSQVQYGGEDAFATVTADPSASYDDEPFCLVFRAPSHDKKAARGQQDHTIAFQVIITLELENKARTRQQTQDYMDDLEELALDALDEADWNDALNGVPAPPQISTWILNATKVDQYIGTAAAGRLLICCIDVEVGYTKDL